LSSKTALNEDERQKIPGLSSKTALYEDERQIIPGSFSKTAPYEDERQIIPGSSSKTAPYEDGVRSYKLMEHQKLNFFRKNQSCPTMSQNQNEVSKMNSYTGFLQK